MVDNHGVSSRVGIHVAGNEPLENCLDKSLASAILLLVIFHAILLAHGDELSQVALGERETLVEIGEGGVGALDGRAVLVDIVDGILVEDALSHEVAIVLAVLGGVDRHKHVGHDATATVDGATVLQCLVA